MELFCTDDGEVLDVSMGDLQMLLGGFGEGLYENVVSSRQQTELSADLWKSLENYLLNMETVQEEQTGCGNGGEASGRAQPGSAGQRAGGWKKSGTSGSRS